MNLYTKDDVANIFFHNIEDRKKRIKKLDNWLEPNRKVVGLHPLGLPHCYVSVLAR